MINVPDMLGPFDLSELEDDIRELVREIVADVQAGKPTRAGTPLVRLGQGDNVISYTPRIAESRGLFRRWWRGMVSRLRRFWRRHVADGD